MSSLDSVLEEHIKECKDILAKNNGTDINSLAARLGNLYFGEVQQITSLGQCKSFDEFGRKELEIIKDALILYRGNKQYNLDIERSKSSNISLKSNQKNESPISLNDIGNVKDSGNSTNENNNTNKNYNTVDIKELFESTKKDIENNGYLTTEEIEQIIEKINEIEGIAQEEVSRPKKWDKLKSVINWMTTKGVDIGVKVYPLIMAALGEN